MRVESIQLKTFLVFILIYTYLQNTNIVCLRREEPTEGESNEGKPTEEKLKKQLESSKMIANVFEDNRNYILSKNMQSNTKDTKSVSSFYMNPREIMQIIEKYKEKEDRENEKLIENRVDPSVQVKKNIKEVEDIIKSEEALFRKTISIFAKDFKKRFINDYDDEDLNENEDSEYSSSEHNVNINRVREEEGVPKNILEYVRMRTKVLFEDSEILLKLENAISKDHIDVKNLIDAIFLVDIVVGIESTIDENTYEKVKNVYCMIVKKVLERVLAYILIEKDRIDGLLNNILPKEYVTDRIINIQNNINSLVTVIQSIQKNYGYGDNLEKNIGLTNEDDTIFRVNEYISLSKQNSPSETLVKSEVFNCLINNDIRICLGNLKNINMQKILMCKYISNEISKRREIKNSSKTDNILKKWVSIKAQCTKIPYLSNKHLYYLLKKKSANEVVNENILIPMEKITNLEEYGNNIKKRIVMWNMDVYETIDVENILFNDIDVDKRNIKSFFFYPLDKLMLMEIYLQEKEDILKEIVIFDNEFENIFSIDHCEMLEKDLSEKEENRDYLCSIINNGIFYINQQLSEYSSFVRKKMIMIITPSDYYENLKADPLITSPMLLYLIKLGKDKFNNIMGWPICYINSKQAKELYEMFIFLEDLIYLQIKDYLAISKDKNLSIEKMQDQEKRNQSMYIYILTLYREIYNHIKGYQEALDDSTRKVHLRSICNIYKALNMKNMIKKNNVQEKAMDSSIKRIQQIEKLEIKIFTYIQK